MYFLINTINLILLNYLLISTQNQIQSTSAELYVWPHPQDVSLSDNYLTINSTNFVFYTISTEICDLLDKAIKRTSDLAFIQDCSRTKPGSKRWYEKTVETMDSKGELEEITIEINKCEQSPHLDMNENYTLVINASTKQAFIQSEQIWGAIRALETFSQLVVNIGNNQFRINETKIIDFPRFAYRGLMVDTSRHYIPLDVLYQNLDAMSYNKLNVFHWHIVDDEAFPYVSKVFPKLSAEGAYDPQTHIYTPEDIQNVIEYARERGIRVVVEFDSPGHTLSWGKGQKDILTECYTKGKPNGEYGPINPTKDSVYKFIEQLFNEVTHTFPDQYFHLGGDEVDFSCWESNPDINQFMSDKKIKTYAKLEDYYMQNVLEIVKKLNKSYIVWEEVFNNGVTLKPDSVIHVWKSVREKVKWQAELDTVTKHGFRTILSSCWYLNLISYGSDWHQYYNCEPHSFNGTDAQNSLVIGGSAAIWAIYVNSANLISRTWPRGIATAERLWSPKTFSDSNKALNRFHRQNCLMISRGIRGEPNEGPGFCKCDYAL